MEPILIISNILLVGLTGTYAWLTNRNVKQLKQESEYYRHVVEKQLRLASLPHLYWDLRPAERSAERPEERSLPQFSAQPAEDPASSVSGQDADSEAVSWQLKKASHLSLEVFNISNVPAYDVHVSLIGAYTEEGLGITTFLRTHVQPRHRKYPLQPDKVGYYGVRHAVRLSLLPTQQKIVLSLPFPVQPVDVYTLVQYRELSGENYYQVCCFSAVDESGAYRANILEPENIQTMERLHLFDLEDFAISESRLHSNGHSHNKDEDKDSLPYYLADFIDLWNHSISSRLLLNSADSKAEALPVKAAYDFSAG